MMVLKDKIVYTRKQIFAFVTEKKWFPKFFFSRSVWLQIGFKPFMYFR